MSLKLTLFAAGALLTVSATGAFAQGVTEPQARSALWNTCANPSALSQDGAGNWHGYCSAGAMMVDTKGNVGPDKGMQGATKGLTNAQAHAALWNTCSNVSSLSQDNSGNWHGYCSSGAMMVDAQGKVAPDTGTKFAGLTQAHAHSIAWDHCSNVSTLAVDAAGSWHGYCSAGPITIDKSGKFSSP